LQEATISFIMFVCPSVRMEQLGSHWRMFITFDIWQRFENLLRKLKFD
jgi:hypothetical protein